MQIGDIRKIGIFRALYLGDMLCIIPTVRAIRVAFPEAKITLIGLPWQKSFVERFSNYFDSFMIFPGWEGLPEQEVNENAVKTFLQEVRNEKFDLVLQMQGNGSITNNMVALWGARIFAGLRRAQDPAPDLQLFPVSEDNEHEVERFLKIPQALNIPLQGTYLEFPISELEKRDADKMLSSMSLTKGAYMCIHAGARDPKRRWSLRNFALISKALIEDGWKILLTGSIAEKDLLTELEDLIGSSVNNLVRECGDLGIGELATIIQESAMLISNDTGVSHVAAALKVPSVVIFSPYSEFDRWVPLNQTLHYCIRTEQAKDAGSVLHQIRHHMNSVHSGIFLNKE
jgi:ADP-heptose:LPS heptosyltransferase